MLSASAARAAAPIVPTPRPGARPWRSALASLLAASALVFASSRAQAQEAGSWAQAQEAGAVLGPRLAPPIVPPRLPALSPEAEAYLTGKQRFLGVLAGWAAVNVGSGAALWLQGDRFGRYTGIQFVAWGAANGILAGVGLSQLPDERASLRGGASLTEKKGKFRRALLVNALADAAYIGAGALLFGLGKNDAVRGTGAGFVAQGTFLLAFDNAGVLSFP